jgi:hypothetical protein
MKRSKRARKRKSEQESKPADQVIVQVETESPASSAETQTEIEPTSSPVEMQVEIEATTSIELQDEIENLVSSIEARQETESPGSPVATSAEPQKPAAGSKAPAAADRRTHPRYAFTAPVEVVAAGPGAHLKMRVRDLSQQGCYVDTDSPLPLGTATDVRITKGAATFEAQARVVSHQPGKGMGLMFTAIPREQHETLDTWIAESRETSWLAANRRRSQRVLMKLPIRVSAQVGGASLLEAETHTLAISAHGALIVLAVPVHRGRRLTLTNIQTKATLECVVVHIDKFPGEQIQVGVEFLLPNPTFWHVAFPPKDWTPRHPEAKSRSKPAKGADTSPK